MIQLLHCICIYCIYFIDTLPFGDFQLYESKSQWTFFWLSSIIINLTYQPFLVLFLIHTLSFFIISDTVPVGGFCSLNIQCTGSLNSGTCENGRCSCLKGFTFIDLACRKGNFETVLNMLMLMVAFDSMCKRQLVTAYLQPSTLYILSFEF